MLVGPTCNKCGKRMKGWKRDPRRVRGMGWTCLFCQRVIVYTDRVNVLW